MRRDFVEKALVEPVIEKLLSPEAVAHAVKTIRDLAKREIKEARRERTQPSEAERRLSEVEALVRNGVLSAKEVSPAIERLRGEINSATQSGCMGNVIPTEAILFRAAAEYQQTARNACNALTGPSAVEGREALRSIIGGVRLQPHKEQDEEFLMAHYHRSQVPLAESLRTGSGVDALVAGAGFEPATFGL